MPNRREFPIDALSFAAPNAARIAPSDAGTDPTQHCTARAAAAHRHPGAQRGGEHRGDDPRAAWRRASTSSPPPASRAVEITVVSDGSTDRTVELASRFADQYPGHPAHRLPAEPRLRRRHPGGLAAARTASCSPSSTPTAPATRASSPSCAARSRPQDADVVARQPPRAATARCLSCAASATGSSPPADAVLVAAGARHRRAACGWCAAARCRSCCRCPTACTSRRR